MTQAPRAQPCRWSPIESVDLFLVRFDRHVPTVNKYDLCRIVIDHARNYCVTIISLACFIPSTIGREGARVAGTPLRSLPNPAAAAAPTVATLSLTDPSDIQSSEPVLLEVFRAP